MNEKLHLFWNEYDPRSFCDAGSHVEGFLEPGAELEASVRASFVDQILLCLNPVNATNAM